MPELKSICMIGTICLPPPGEVKSPCKDDSNSSFFRTDLALRRAWIWLWEHEEEEAEALVDDWEEGCCLSEEEREEAWHARSAEEEDAEEGLGLEATRERGALPASSKYLIQLSHTRTAFLLGTSLFLEVIMTGKTLCFLLHLAQTYARRGILQWGLYLARRGK